MKMQNAFIALSFIILISCQQKKKELLEEGKTQSFFVGTYTDGESEGIYKYALQEDGTLQRIGLAAVSDNPSFLAKSADHKFLIVVNEINNKDSVGTVESFSISNDSLTFINRSSSGGAHPCFIAVNDAGYVLTANYTSGNVGLLKLNTKGELSDLLDTQQHSGKGSTDRQDAPHAHSTWFMADNHIVSVDLGSNELWMSQLDTTQQKLVLSEPSTLKMALGDGPRHLTFHPNKKWIYVLNELNNTVTLIQKDSVGQYKKGATTSMLPVGFTEHNTGADIHISSDGKFLYASNRGHNSIVIFQVNAIDGSLTLTGHESTRGNGPRNFSLSPDENYLLVANQLTNNIISFKRDKTTGLLQFIDEVEVPTPVCILF
jgi:6-phosphogluconolactonase